jgi:hypothetical protein
MCFVTMVISVVFVSEGLLTNSNSVTQYTLLLKHLYLEMLVVKDPRRETLTQASGQPRTQEDTETELKF